MDPLIIMFSLVTATQGFMISRCLRAENNYKKIIVELATIAEKNNDASRQIILHLKKQEERYEAQQNRQGS